LDDCNRCNGDAYKGDDLHYPDNYYIDCYNPGIDALDDDPVVGDGPEGGWFTCPLISGGASTLSMFQYTELIFGINGDYGIGLEPIDCTTYGYSNTVSYDAGCSDSDACNYKAYHEGCLGEGPGTELTDTACCVYPVSYCDSSEPVDYVDGTGSTTCCSVDINNAIISEVYYCTDVFTAGYNAGSVPANEQFAGGPNTWNLETHNPATPGGGGGTVSYELNATLVANNWVPVTNGTDTTCTGCTQGGICGMWDITGCPDSVAVNFEADTLYEAATSGVTVDIYSQIGVTFCNYCDTGDTFYWKNHYLPEAVAATTHGVTAVTDSLNASVLTAISANGGTSMYLDLTDDDKIGACFNNTDLAVLDGFNDSRAVPSAHSIQMTNNAGHMTWNSEGHLVEFIASDVRQGYSGTNVGITNIPSDIGNLDSLVLLDLGYNDISGNIPLAISGLNLIQQLYLNDNSCIKFKPLIANGIFPDISLYPKSNSTKESKFPISLGILVIPTLVPEYPCLTSLAINSTKWPSEFQVMWPALFVI
jgi:hypothetical protein